MGKLLDFESPFRQRFITNLVNKIGSLNDQATIIAEEYQGIMMDSPNEAIKRLPEFIKKARRLNPEPAYAELAGGPNHDWTGPLLDIIGTIYPELPRESRETALKQCLGFLDFLNYNNAQDNVALINEPWLATDIVITRPSYWCGYKQYCTLAQNNPTWTDFSRHMDSAQSAFWLAMAVTEPKYTSLQVRHHFYDQFPNLMDRTKDALAAIAAVYGKRKAEHENVDFNDSITVRLSKHDPLLHDDIRRKIEEKKWIFLER